MITFILVDDSAGTVVEDDRHGTMLKGLCFATLQTFVQGRYASDS